LKVSKNACLFTAGTGVFTAAVLHPDASITVFKAAVLSIMLTLAAGPSASLLCRAWCDSQATAAGGCHHEAHATSPSVAGDDNCDDTMVSGDAFLREDAPRGVSTPDADQAVLVVRFQLPRSPSAVRPGQKPWREWSLEQRPLSTTLRI
jgi:hypothetical protein